MKKWFRKGMACLLALALILSLDPVSAYAAGKADVKLSKKTVTVKKGKKASVTVKLTKECRLVSLRVTKVKNKKIAAVKTKKNKLIVKGKKKGTTKATVLVSYQKEGKTISKKLTLKVKVKTTAKKKVTPPPKNSLKPSTTPAPSQTPNNNVTRRDWIKTLCEVMSIDISGIDAETVDYDFVDIERDTCALQIEAAYRYGLLPDEYDVQDVPYFNPGYPVTREYMAYTMSKALGIQNGDKEGACSDLAKSRYPQEVANALGAGLMKLQNNAFSPAAYATREDVEYAKKRLGEWNASSDLSGRQAYDRSTYAAAVRQITDCTQYTLTEGEDGNNTLELGDATDVTLSKGDVVVLGANEEHPQGIAQKITDVTADGSYLCETPKLEEVYTDIELLGQGQADSSHAKAASDDITMTVDTPEPTQTPEASTQSLKRSSLKKVIGGTLNTSDVKVEFDMGDGKKITDNLKLKGKVAVSIPEITALMDAHASLSKGVSIDELTLSLRSKVDISGGLYWTVAESGQSLQDGSYENDIQGTLAKAKGSGFEGGRMELGYIPINFAGGIGVNIHFFAEFSMKGEVTITYTINGQMGIQYKDGTLRNLCDFSHTLSLFEVSGNGAIQAGVAIDLAFMEVFDIVGVTFQIGPAFNVKLTPHVFATDALVCANASLYLGAKATLDQESILGYLLKETKHITVEHEFLKDDSNNPLRLNFHMENLKKVPECTFGAGRIEGSVIDSATGKALKNAMVRIYLKDEDGSDLLIRKKYTDASGKYLINNLTDGTYTIVVTATGYKEYRIDDVAIVKESTNTADTARMVKRDNSNGTLNFCVVSAVSGEELTGWEYEITSANTYCTMADIKGTSDTAQFSRAVESGNYQVKISIDGYIPVTQSVSVLPGSSRETTIAISPKFVDIGDDDAIRFVLTWGKEPYDLDSHVFIKDASGKVQGHVYYNNKEFENDDTCVKLDVDDRDSYGPETITLEKSAQDYTYSYYIYDYTNQGDDSNALSMSSARGSVYAGNRLLYSFHVPYYCDGTAWKLFDYQPSTGGLKIYNQMGDSMQDEEFGESIDWADDAD